MRLVNFESLNVKLSMEGKEIIACSELGSGFILFFWVGTSDFSRSLRWGLGGGG